MLWLWRVPGLSVLYVFSQSGELLQQAWTFLCPVLCVPLKIVLQVMDTSRKVTLARPGHLPRLFSTFAMDLQPSDHWHRTFPECCLHAMASSGSALHEPCSQDQVLLIILLLNFWLFYFSSSAKSRGETLSEASRARWPSRRSPRHRRHPAGWHRATDRGRTIDAQDSAARTRAIGKWLPHIVIAPDCRARTSRLDTAPSHGTSCRAHGTAPCSHRTFEQRRDPL